MMVEMFIGRTEFIKSIYKLNKLRFYIAILIIMFIKVIEFFYDWHKMADTNIDKIKDEFKQLSFEDALKNLETLIRQLESGEVSLEESISLYERGSILKSLCEEKLKQAQMRVEQIIETQSGVKTEAFSNS